MNLVAKEYIAAQDEEDPGVLILSRFAGAAAECNAALLVNPHDPEAVGSAIERALTMTYEERRQRHDALFQVISENDINVWGERFLAALAGPATPAIPAAERPELVGPRLVVGGGVRRGLASNFRA
jgi:trehalose 6-phosphate synthase